MGIRFLCRHCKKRLNIKATQAGRKGKCPHCQGTIDVPMESTLTGARQRRVGGVEHPDFEDPSSEDPSSEDLQRETFSLGQPDRPVTFGKIDPIAESPDRIWYFRSRSLGEKGPLKSQVMREYVDRGEVTVGCVVWRDDWSDWAPAEKAFPELAKLAKSQKQKARLEQAIKDSTYKFPDELLHPPRRNYRLAVAIAVVIGLLVVALLVYVFLKFVK